MRCYHNFNGLHLKINIKRINAFGFSTKAHSKQFKGWIRWAGHLVNYGKHRTRNKLCANQRSFRTSKFELEPGEIQPTSYTWFIREDLRERGRLFKDNFSNRRLRRKPFSKSSWTTIDRVKIYSWKESSFSLMLNYSAPIMEKLRLITSNRRS